MASNTIARHQRPTCGHTRLVECPLTVKDWESVFFAYLGFLHVCRLVSEQAHEREEGKTRD